MGELVEYLEVDFLLIRLVRWIQAEYLLFSMNRELPRVQKLLKEAHEL